MSQSPRNPKEEAQRLCDLHKQELSLDYSQWDKFHARSTALAIIKALEITTGHCTLNKQDWNEVRKDIDYWRQVEFEIHKL